MAWLIAASYNNKYSQDAYVCLIVLVYWCTCGSTNDIDKVRHITMLCSITINFTISYESAHDLVSSIIVLIDCSINMNNSL